MYLTLFSQKIFTEIDCLYKLFFADFLKNCSKKELVLNIKNYRNKNMVNFTVALTSYTYIWVYIR